MFFLEHYNGSTPATRMNDFFEERRARFEKVMADLKAEKW